MALRQWLADRFGRSPVYMTGIKGQGMSALARVLAANGVQVVGSDSAASFVTDFRLQHPNIKVLTGFGAGQIPAGARQYIYSAGYPLDHVEIAAARQRGMAVASYPEFMGQLTRVLPTVSVAGTHGKTTTVQLIGHLLRAAGWSPVVVSGGGEVDTGAAERGPGPGPGPEVLVLESCEFRRHFLNYRPRWAVITNIDHDHPDSYPDLDSVAAAFADFANVTAPDGAVVLTDNCPRSAGLAVEPPRRRVFCGLGEQAEVRGEVLSTGPCRMVVHYSGQPVGQANTQLWGLHNVYNSLQGLAVTRAMGVDPAVALPALSTFPGVPRRLTYLGMVGRAKVMDDFAHHPSAIASSIRALREMNPGRLVVIFQPHTFSRTRALLPEFGQALAGADEIALIPIYGSVREPTGDISSAALLPYLPADKVRVVPNSDLVSYVRQVEQPGMMIVFMGGAGDIGTIAREVFAAAGGTRGAPVETPDAPPAACPPPRPASPGPAPPRPAPPRPASPGGWSPLAWGCACAWLGYWCQSGPWPAGCRPTPTGSNTAGPRPRPAWTAGNWWRP